MCVCVILHPFAASAFNVQEKYCLCDTECESSKSGLYNARLVLQLLKLFTFLHIKVMNSN